MWKHSSWIARSHHSATTKKGRIKTVLLIMANSGNHTFMRQASSIRALTPLIGGYINSLNSQMWNNYNFCSDYYILDKAQSLALLSNIDQFILMKHLSWKICHFQAFIALGWMSWWTYISLSKSHSTWKGKKYPVCDKNCLLLEILDSIRHTCPLTLISHSHWISLR